ncbi:MAG: branched-chain amino acid ABC transporter permease [Oscillospiraceae bacterium]|nr:branched-chain amino acid ABC transporter permease [Oscillospiraceae bacterium]
MRKIAGLTDTARLKINVFPATVLVFVILYALGFSGILPANVMRYLLQIFLYIALGEAWNLMSGFAGMTSLGQQLYVGLAGYAAAILTGIYMQPLPTVLPAAALVCVIAAIPVSAILFRMQGMYFAVATWVAAEAAEKLFLNWKFVGQGSGMTIRLSPYPSVGVIYLLALTVCMLAVLTVYRITRSRLGMGLLAMRDDPVAAASIGLNLTRTRLTVYLLAALISGLAGSVFFLNKGMIYPESGFSISWTVSVVFVCIIGGAGTVAGPVIGAVIYVLLREYLAHYPGWSNIMLGAITLLVIFFFPEGIAGALKKKKRIN